MHWLWEHVFQPLFRIVYEVLKTVFQWAWDNPIAAMVIGGTAIVISWFIDNETSAAILATWGWGMVVVGLTAWAGGGAWRWIEDAFQWVSEILGRLPHPGM